MKTIKLTAAQALVRYLSVQQNENGERFLAGIWAIFGHGNVAGLGEALQGAGNNFPTWRGHNEQTMAHAAIAYAKTLNRTRAMAVTTSIGPGATNLVTACALAHVNRLPVLFLPGDVFASRAPDPVLQQVENFSDGTISANDCLRPVSRYFDRITRPEQLLSALPRAIAIMNDMADCGPVTLALCQDVQAEAYDYPAKFFELNIWHKRRPRADKQELARAAAAIRSSKKPLIIAGGGVLYSGAVKELVKFAERHQIPVCETQAGKSCLPFDHELNLGSIGVTGASSANAVARDADMVIAVGSRLQDFTTGSRALFQNKNHKLLSINIAACDAQKHGGLALVGDAKTVLSELGESLGDFISDPPDPSLKAEWMASVEAATAKWEDDTLPSDAQIIGAVQRSVDEDAIVVCAAGGLPGELHKLWKATKPNSYHVEYGFSCMGYEIAGGLGVKMAHGDRETIVMVGDGSYMMANSELATSLMLGLKIIVVVLDNRGFGCINRLQLASGGEGFNNLLDDSNPKEPSAIDFAAHAGAMGAEAEKVSTVDEFELAMIRANKSQRSYVIVIETDPMISTEAGGAWWDVPIPQTSQRAQVQKAYLDYREKLKSRRSAN